MVALLKPKTKNILKEKKVSKPSVTKSAKIKIKSAIKKLSSRVAKKDAKKSLTLPSIKNNYPKLIHKFIGNPIMRPKEHSFWEDVAVLNPAAVVHNGRVHLFYRAMGADGVSRIGYASSKNGVDFDERMVYPVFVPETKRQAMKHYPNTSPVSLVYDPILFGSGGGWGGCEDPRAVKLDGKIYMTFNMLNGWESMRVGYTSISERDFENKVWNWAPFKYLTRPGDRQKNWVIFPEKFDGKFAIFHNLDMVDHNPHHVGVALVDELDMYKVPYGDQAPDPQRIPDNVVAWHNRTRSASAPPIKTRDGWLLFYHAMDKSDGDRYKLGAMLLDLKDPTKVLYRSQSPILSPDEWYENDWKPGIIYASGIVVKDGILFIYYGGGDKHIAVAYEDFEKFMKELKENGRPILTKKSKLKL